MDIRLIDNQKKSLLNVICSNIRSSNEIKFAIAFAKNSGFSKIKEDLIDFVNKGNFAEIILGLDFRITDPTVLFELLNINKPNFQFWCFSNPDLDRVASYHPKLYLFCNPTEVKTIIGSSNLTSGGLQENIELNIEVTVEKCDEFVSDVYESYNLIKFTEHCFCPSIEYVHNYESIYKKILAKKIDKGKVLIKEIKEKEVLLPKPIIKNRDLSGWMRLVYEVLPANEFHTKDIYAFEQDFKRKYPLNQNIQAKIRQQLQFLAKIGLISHIERNVWKKKNNI